MRLDMGLGLKAVLGKRHEASLWADHGTTHGAGLGIGLFSDASLVFSLPAGAMPRD